MLSSKPGLPPASEMGTLLNQDNPAPFQRQVRDPAQGYHHVKWSLPTCPFSEISKIIQGPSNPPNQK